ncbi:hypothetical protein OHB26_29550 [Nocardia sp. NBC_01503]|uniref:hypothetical protein n=1 Tax=Nocardia sp. NBC_01503 TaxID=2975997 RepID=UPI002E7BBF2D|nr:hypothetical protein [Nocardia sp. NBC_01503]WTL31032.1 hypothetical protein OHB26_29550 [Nocardia sp. NBC_01503]
MDALHSHGLDLELVPRRLSGPLVPGRHPRKWIGAAILVPALGLIAVFVVLPALCTLWLAAVARPGLTVGCAILVLATLPLAAARGLIARFPRPATPLRIGASIWTVLIAAVGLSLIVHGLTPDGLRAYVITIGWVVYAALLVLLALRLAWSTRRFRWTWRPLILPFGISAFTAGIAVRLLFDRITADRELGGVVAYRIAFVVMLLLAFGWTWLGLLTGLFRAALLAIDADPVRAGQLHDETEPHFVIRLLRLMQPVWLVAFLVVGVAAARVFDAVLAAVPRSMQYQIDTATVYWWRTSAACGPWCGAAAAYALPLAVVTGSAAVWAQAGMRGHRMSWSAAIARLPETGRERTGVGQAVIVAVLSAVALVPIGMLVWQALGSSGRPVSTELREILHDRALWNALATTAEVAVLATLIVLLVAVQVAHRLAAVRAGLGARIVVPGLAILTVLPAQMYLGPLHDAINAWGFAGTRVPLIFTHAAAGLPISILILRGALLAPAYTPAADALYGLAPPRVVAGRVLRAVRPALGAVAVLEFVQVWNDFFIGLLISGAGASPWSLLLWGDTRQFEQNSAQLAAGALVSAIVPVTLLLLFWRRWLVPGLTGGAVR